MNHICIGISIIILGLVITFIGITRTPKDTEFSIIIQDDLPDLETVRIIITEVEED